MNVWKLSFLFFFGAMVLQAYQPTGTYKVAVYENPPLIILEEGQPPRGIFPEFLSSLKLGGNDIEFEYLPMSFREGMDQLKKGEVDILPSIAFTYERQKEMLFSKLPIVQNRAVLFKNTNIPFSGIEDVNGKRVAVLDEDIHAEAFRNLCDVYGMVCEYVTVDHYDVAVNLLQTNEVDLAVLNFLYSLNLSSTRNIVSTQVLFNPVAIRLAFRPTMDQNFISWVDGNIEKQLNKPTSPLSRALSRHLAPSPEVQIPEFVWSIVILLVALIVIVVLFNRTLQMKVNQRTKDLQIQKERAEAASVSKSHFLANINHEIRTPLNGILGFSQLLEMQEEMSKEEREWVSAIIESSHKLEKILSQILHYSSLVSGRSTLKEGSFDLQHTYGEVLESLSLRAGMDISKITPQLETVSGTTYASDASCWFLILDNLLSNALQFSEGSPVFLSAREELDAYGRYLIVIVEDKGPGIPKDKINQLLLPFEQLDTSSVRKYEGLGLGLSLVQATVHQLNGSVELESPGKGLRVTVRCPIRISSTSEPEKPNPELFLKA